MNAEIIKGYFDGIHIILEDSSSLTIGQKVKIMVDDSDIRNQKASDMIRRYRGSCRGLLGGRDAQECVNELRANDRVYTRAQ